MSRREPLTIDQKKRLRAQVRKLAAGETAEYCEAMASFIFMGPVPERDRVVGKAWEAEARRKRESVSGWVPAKVCPYCKGPAHVYFCLRDPRYLADPDGFVKTAEATTPKATHRRAK